MEKNYKGIDWMWKKALKLWFRLYQYVNRLHSWFWKTGGKITLRTKQLKNILLSVVSTPVELN